MKVKIIARNYFRVEIGNQANLIFMNIIVYRIDLQNLNPKKAALNADVIFSDKVISLNDKVNKKN